MSLNRKDVAGFYVGLFHRASEGAGNLFWQQYSKTHSTNKVVAEMIESARGMGVYPDVYGNNESYVKVLYKNILDRSPYQDTGGINHWTNSLNVGAETRGSLLEKLISVCTSSYRANSDNRKDKHEHNLFVNKEIVSDYSAGVTWDHYTRQGFPLNKYERPISYVTDDSTSVEQAKDYIDSNLGVLPDGFVNNNYYDFG